MQVKAGGVSVEFSLAHAIRFGAGPQDEYDIPNRVLASPWPLGGQLFRPQAREPGRAAAGADRSHLDERAKLDAARETEVGSGMASAQAAQPVKKNASKSARRKENGCPPQQVGRSIDQR
jgi:hypothetical protein